MTVSDAIEAYRALGHEARLTIMQTLATGEMNVGDIERATGIAQPGLSQQLAILRNAGLVVPRRQAKAVFYSVDQKLLAELADLTASLGRVARGSSPGPSGIQFPATGGAVFAQILPD